MDEDRIPLAEAARRYDEKLVTLQRAVNRGYLPAVKVGSTFRGSWMVTIADVEAYIASRSKRARSRVENERDRPTAE